METSQTLPLRVRVVLGVMVIYISNIYDLVWFDGISAIIGNLMPNPLYTYISNIYDLVWSDLVRFDGITAIIGNLMPNPFDKYI